jgi:hypothetical protein
MKPSADASATIRSPVFALKGGVLTAPLPSVQTVADISSSAPPALAATTRLTADPGATSEPPAGDWLITDPTGVVALTACVTVPTTRPAFVIAVVAAACVRPTTPGTATGGGPDETVSVTTVPMITCVPLAGL